jgi:uncharacterized protein involved in oxidation of intracellular sulfur
MGAPEESGPGQCIRRATLTGVRNMKALFILNDPPYGTERCYNALRLASALVKNDPSTEITVFLMADAVSCAKRGQKTPSGYYSLERMLRQFTTGNHKVLLCGTCMDARGLTEPELLESVRRSSMDELAKATVAADKVVVF